jgi:hypothetical protein
MNNKVSYLENGLEIETGPLSIPPSVYTLEETLDNLIDRIDKLEKRLISSNEEFIRELMILKAELTAQ